MPVPWSESSSAIPLLLSLLWVSLAPLSLGQSGESVSQILLHTQLSVGIDEVASVSLSHGLISSDVGIPSFNVLASEQKVQEFLRVMLSCGLLQRKAVLWVPLRVHDPHSLSQKSVLSFYLCAPSTEPCPLLDFTFSASGCPGHQGRIYLMPTMLPKATPIVLLPFSEMARSVVHTSFDILYTGQSQPGYTRQIFLRTLSLASLQWWLQYVLTFSMTLQTFS